MKRRLLGRISSGWSQGNSSHACRYSLNTQLCGFVRNGLLSIAATCLRELLLRIHKLLRIDHWVLGPGNPGWVLSVGRIGASGNHAHRLTGTRFVTAPTRNVSLISPQSLEQTRSHEVMRS